LAGVAVAECLYALQRHIGRAVPVVWLYFSPRGRITRAMYWYAMAPLLMMQALALVGLIMLHRSDVPVLLVLNALMLWPALALGTKRLHDQGISGLWLVGYLIPLINLILAIQIGFVRGMPGPNRYGADPLAAAK
jgi:uncharacterized membrane protein YhaH (DUF805 family)